MLSFDGSNFTTGLTLETATKLREDGALVAIWQAIDPPGPALPVVRDQIKLWEYVGGLNEAYLWPWLDYDDQAFGDDLKRKLDLLDGLTLAELWMDWEDVAAARLPNSFIWERMARSFEIADPFPTTHGEKCGEYSGRWWHKDMAGNPTFPAEEGRELWDANYDGQQDAAVGFVPYGGWTRPAIKQWIGSSALAGVGGIDLDVLSDQEVAELMPDNPTPDPQPAPDSDPVWVAKKSLVVNTLGLFAGDLYTGLSQEAQRRYGPRRSVVQGYADRQRDLANAALA